MKVLRLIGGLDPAHGGPPVSSVNSCLAAQRAGAATTFAFPADPAAAGAIGPALERLRAEGVETVVFPYLGVAPRTARRWGISPALGRWVVCNRGRYDIVHCHGAWQFLTLLALIGGGRARRPRALTPHESLTGFDIARSGSRLTGAAKRVLRPRFLRGFDRIIVSSALEARDSIPADMAGDVAREVIRHPVYDERRRTPAARDRPAADGGLRLGFLGRLHAKKNVDVLIAALALLPETVTLAVAGDGPERDRLRRLAQDAGVSGRIDWLGFVADGGKPAFFGAIDVLAMPSDYECFGMAAAEALVEGVPVLVAPGTGIGEIVAAHRCGEVLAPEPEALARRIAELTGAPAVLAEYSRRAARAACDELSFAAHGEALVRCYQAMLREAGCIFH